MGEDDDDKEKEEEKIEAPENNLILISEKRLRELVSLRHIDGCKCKKNYEIEIIRDGFEASISRICHTCALKRIGKRYAHLFTQGKKEAPIYKTNLAIIYHSVIEDYGFAGLKRLQAALGMPVMGNYKYGRYLTYLCLELQDKERKRMSLRKKKFPDRKKVQKKSNEYEVGGF